jgi:hypothetical protein
VQRQQILMEQQQRRVIIGVEDRLLHRVKAPPGVSIDQAGRRLEQRQQQIVIGGLRAAQVQPASGVGQGSVNVQGHFLLREQLSAIRYQPSAKNK